MLDRDAIRLRLVEARAWRTALDQVIVGYEALLGEKNGGGDSSEVRLPTEIHPDTFIGKSIAEAARVYLRMVGRPARTTDEIHQALIRGGVQKASKDSVATLLLRDYKEGGDIYKAGKSLWGLAEWYGRSPRRRPSIRRARAAEQGDSGQEENGDKQEG